MAGRELVRKVKDETGVERALHLVVVRSAGTSADELADLYDLRTDQVMQAIRFEMRNAQARTAAQPQSAGAHANDPLVRR